MKEFIKEVNNDLKLIQNADGLTYGTDAYLLSAFIKKEPSSSAVEYGSGSGIISLLLASRGKFKRIVAVEKQEYYASLTERNTALNGFNDIIEAKCLDIRELDLPCDVVFSNPPYMKAESGRKNNDYGKYEARHEANGTICDFCRSASKNLKYGGKLYFVYRPDRLVDIIFSMRDCGVEPKQVILVSQDEAHEPCLMLILGKKGGRSGIKLKNFYLCKKGSNELTEPAKYVYENGAFPSEYLL